MYYYIVAAITLEIPTLFIPLWSTLITFAYYLLHSSDQ